MECRHRRWPGCRRSWFAKRSRFKERGLSDTFNPWEVPIYEWVDGEAVRRKLTDFLRTPLVTYYLQKDGEPEYHLVDEPFDYDKVKG